MNRSETYHHRRLNGGLELAVLQLPGRATTSFQIRVLCGLVDEPEERPGLARIVEETIAKGTESRSARQLSDAFDAIGAQHSSGVGRESIVFQCGCLPEYVDDALALHAEMLRTPTFPEEFCRVAVDLGLQELRAIEDEPGEFAQRLIAPHAFGPVLGRHELGTPDGLNRMTRKEIVTFWKTHLSLSRLQVCVAGAVDVERFAERLEGLFDGLPAEHGDGADRYSLTFAPGARHHNKNLEQEHILICWPGVSVTDADYPVERVVLGLLGGGMSSRLFSEVREKLGLVYWVGAWDEHPRTGGRIFLGASTTPARCDRTAQALLRQVDGLAEDLAEPELDRAKAGILAREKTHGDITRARLRELGRDLFHFGRPVPTREKNEQIAAVTVADVRRYLATHPRDRLCIQTLGPRPLDEGTL